MWGSSRLVFGALASWGVGVAAGASAVVVALLGFGLSPRAASFRWGRRLGTSALRSPGGRVGVRGCLFESWPVAALVRARPAASRWCRWGRMMRSPDLVGARPFRGRHFEPLVAGLGGVTAAKGVLGAGGGEIPGGSGAELTCGTQIRPGGAGFHGLGGRLVLCWWDCSECLPLGGGLGSCGPNQPGAPSGRGRLLGNGRIRGL